VNHVFVIPVYGDAPHLDDCIASILRQSVGRPRLLLTTSTPSQPLADVAARHGIELRLNPVRADIGTDWNFALSVSGADYVTIAHQDDRYDPRYLSVMTELEATHPRMSLAFSDYREHTDLGSRPTNMNLRIKRVLCARAFGKATAIDARSAKQRLLNLGNPICCPSVLLNRCRFPDFRFDAVYKTNLDWDAWLRLAAEPGEFVYSRQALVSKRVHMASETSVTIANRVRQNEDLAMFRRLWPPPVAALIAAVYSLGYLANRV
jgi:glycosyltransferase involved in cell wall biosynthesis